MEKNENEQILKKDNISVASAPSINYNTLNGWLFCYLFMYMVF